MTALAIQFLSYVRNDMYLKTAICKKRYQRGIQKPSF